MWQLYRMTIVLQVLFSLHHSKLNSVDLCADNAGGDSGSSRSPAWVLTLQALSSA